MVSGCAWTWVALCKLYDVGARLKESTTLSSFALVRAFFLEYPNFDKEFNMAIRALLPAVLVLAALFTTPTVAGGNSWTPSGHGNHWRGPPGGWGPPVPHNASFVPDHVLRLTYENVSVGCQSRASVLINGTLPGPELRLQPGKTSWIRVYNDMTDYNATMVRLLESTNGAILTIAALARSVAEDCHLFRRHAVSESMADRSFALF
jgi:hypothetical protein